MLMKDWADCKFKERIKKLLKKGRNKPSLIMKIPEILMATDESVLYQRLIPDQNMALNLKGSPFLFPPSLLKSQNHETSFIQHQKRAYKVASKCNLSYPEKELEH
ncbi:unnamed protein product [Moneuplotes crassus]|uniref:Uncharacterized protein n=1 Tax=Euplotes crassus TaxID=5936 RepID=A0AAD1X927_EUPCR|nr:unnamed protein product [Moneuplotes crassus]